jgi:hypothetical protein
MAFLSDGLYSKIVESECNHITSRWKSIAACPVLKPEILLKYRLI